MNICDPSRSWVESRQSETEHVCLLHVMAEIPQLAPHLLLRDSHHRIRLLAIVVQSRRISLASTIASVWACVRKGVVSQDRDRREKGSRKGNKRETSLGVLGRHGWTIKRRQRQNRGEGKGHLLRLTESHEVGPSHRTATSNMAG